MNNDATYDEIGVGYALKRQTDPRIADQFHRYLKGATRILNIGAGAGSYEPRDVDLIAIEPSIKMIEQRLAGAHPVIQGSAENLPFDDNSFSHTMTVLSMHHWQDRSAAFQEIKRVTTDKFVAISWNPEADPFWLTRDYFPEIYQEDCEIFPSIEELNAYFTDVNVSPLMIPHDCIDGFLAAYWKRPEAYLDPEVRKSISTFAKLEAVEQGIEKLKLDLKTGDWAIKNRNLLDKDSINVGYIVISVEL